MKNKARPLSVDRLGVKPKFKWYRNRLNYIKSYGSRYRYWIKLINELNYDCN